MGRWIRCMAGKECKKNATAINTPSWNARSQTENLPIFIILRSPISFLFFLFPFTIYSFLFLFFFFLFFLSFTKGECSTRPIRSFSLTLFLPSFRSFASGERDAPFIAGKCRIAALRHKRFGKKCPGPLLLMRLRLLIVTAATNRFYEILIVELRQGLLI